MLLVIDPPNVEGVKAAMQTGFAVTISYLMPKLWLDISLWEPTDDDVLGGTADTLTGYNQLGFTFTKWNRHRVMTWAAFEKHVTEAAAIGQPAN